MNATTSKVTYIAAYIGQFGDANGWQIEACCHEPWRLSRPDLASRGLNRPCELSELMLRNIAA
jgi:hypothetical protein